MAAVRMLRVPHEVIILTRHVLVAATEAIVAPIAVPRGIKSRSQKAGKKLPQKVQSRQLSRMLREELQVVVDPPFGVLACARRRPRCRPRARGQLIRLSITKTPEGCPLQGGPLCDEPQRQRCGVLVLSLDALSG